MKTIKRTLAVVLTLLMLIGVVPVGVMNASASSSSVKTVLDEVESVYSAGTYFTANRKACNHSSGSTCSNCKLATILDSADCKKIKKYSNSTYNANTWTCFSFASFCFTQCFGKSYVKDNYTKTIDSNDLFSTRTDFTNQSVAIKKEFFSYGRIGDIIKCFRYAKGDDGNYHYYHKHSMVFISADSTGVTVFDANVDGDSSHTGVVRKAKIKYENIKHYNIEILHAKNYDEKVTVTFNGNGGTPSKTSETFNVGEKYGDSMPSALRNGYSFDGWYTSASGGTWCGKNTVAQSSVTTLYAHWSKNNTDVLQVGHIYKIYNKKSGLPLQTNGQGAGAYICQREEESTTKQLWRVTYADDDGYYSFESLYSCNAMDMDGTPRYDYLQHLQLWTPSNSDAQKFSLVKREDNGNGTDYYSIHVKYSGRALDVYDSSTEPGAAIVQWDSHRGANQLFYFVERPARRVQFYDNLNNNYLPSPKEVYEHIGSTVPTNDCYSTRDASAVSVQLNPSENGLVIKALKAGSTSQDMDWKTSLNGSYAFDNYVLNDGTMGLNFKAKSSVAGAKIVFRWGWDSEQYPVTLSTSWKEYSVMLPRTIKSGLNIHPFIDSACTVEIKDIELYDVDTNDYYIGDTDYYSSQDVFCDIYNTESCLTPLPSVMKEGYSFVGWYTKRVGGEKVAEGNDFYDPSNLDGNQKLYAHWIKNEVHSHIYNKTVKAPTCTEKGYTTYICSICGDSYSDNFIAAVGHDYRATVKEATCTQGGYTTYTCESCGDTYVGNEVKALDHNYIETYVPESCTKDGYMKYQCSRCEDSYKEIISATGHQDNDDDSYCDFCSIELRPHDDPTNPTNPTSPTEPATPSQPQGNMCKWCGKTHDSGFIQKLIGFFHNILASIFGAKY